MNLQQLRYLVATADAGTMTRAAQSVHVAQPSLSRAVRALEVELGVTVFERDGRGIRVTPQGDEIVAIARRILAEVDRLAGVAGRDVLRVTAIVGQAREIASPAVARFVTTDHRRAALDVVDMPADVVERVRDGRARVGILDLPVPRDLHAISLGWQELVLLHPRDWRLDDPLDVMGLADVPLLSPGSGDWRHAAIEDGLRSFGIRPTIAAEASDPDLLVGLVQEGAGAWFSYGRQAQAAVDGGAGVVHLDPPLVREIGVVTVDGPDRDTNDFIDIARAETAATLWPVGDPMLDRAVWIRGTTLFTTPPPATTVRPPPLTPA